MQHDLTAILKRFAEDYAKDPMLTPGGFGVRAAGREWRIDAAPGDVRVSEGATAARWRFVFEDAADLIRLDCHQTHVGALMAKPSTGERTPLDIDFAVAPTPEDRAAAMRVAMHFWTRGQPEIVPFASLSMPDVHGVAGALLYAAPGMKALWFSIAEGQVANGKGEGVGPYMKLMIVVRGEGFCRIGENEAPLKAGDRLLVPPNVRNEFRNEKRAPMEGVLIVFGDGA